MKSVSLHHQNNLKSTGSTSFLQHNRQPVREQCALLQLQAALGMFCPFFSPVEETASFGNQTVFASVLRNTFEGSSQHTLSAFSSLNAFG
jgi:hypothetical protein